MSRLLKVAFVVMFCINIVGILSLALLFIFSTAGVILLGRYYLVLLVLMLSLDVAYEVAMSVVLISRKRRLR